LPGSKIFVIVLSLFIKYLVLQSQLGGVITSGGGFSAYYPRPLWQNASVSKYLAHMKASAGYNSQGRGYPDLSMLGVLYETVLGGSTVYMSGTSASAPSVAAMSEFRATQCHSILII
jgi:tripeptidyl-peptidase-1